LRAITPLIIVIIIIILDTIVAVDITMESVIAAISGTATGVGIWPFGR
jgi:hypothetical protein